MVQGGVLMLMFILSARGRHHHRAAFAYFSVAVPHMHACGRVHCFVSNYVCIAAAEPCGGIGDDDDEDGVDDYTFIL